MQIPTELMEALKNILENIQHPGRLDTHPWTESLIVQQAGVDSPEYLAKSPGQRLVHAVGEAFKKMMPSIPPRRGKRLDTRWGEFGILASEYFAPLIYGEASPGSLQAAWGTLDRSILLFVYGKKHTELTAQQVQAYQFAGGEAAVAPISTLSDWHRKGLQHLLEVILAHESYLEGILSKPAVITLNLHQENKKRSPAGISGRRGDAKSSKSPWLRATGIAFAVILVVAVLLVGTKGWQIYRQAKVVRADISSLLNVLQGPGPVPDRLLAASEPLDTLKNDFDVFQNEVEPYLWLGPWLAWVPVHGGDLAAARDLILLTDGILSSADISYRAFMPLLEEYSSGELDPVRITEYLVQVQPQVQEARLEIDRALAAHIRLDVEKLSPEVSGPILTYIDPYLPLLQNGLVLAEEIPQLMGASEEGPKTYLLLAQNEDELRPTGGFITSAGTVLIRNGQIGKISFVNSDYYDDWSLPYPAAPWQLQEYMNSSVLVLRDSNWFTNYPTTALYAETLYSYVSDQSVDGVIAFDQQFLVYMLEMTGPINVEGIADPIDSGNVIDSMRLAKIPTIADRSSGLWDRKFFIQAIAETIIEKAYAGEIPLEDLIQLVLRSLNEHHLLVQIDNPALTALLVDYQWDGAVRREDGDFLMVVDSNIGFNKTNAVIEARIVYDLDLTSLGSPTSKLSVFHQNNADELICKHWNKIRISDLEKYYPISDCYWNYLRVYVPEGAILIDSQTQSVPAYWMIGYEDVPAHVDHLDEEIDGIQAFGTLMVVPGQDTAATIFHYSLPANMLSAEADGNLISYHLFIQKQPGTRAIPLTITALLPEGAVFVTIPVGAVNQGESIEFQTDLRTDVRFDIVFQTP